MSLLVTVHNNILPGEVGATDAVTSQATFVSPTSVANLYACEYQPAFDILATAFQTCPTLNDEMTRARALALSAHRELQPIPISEAPMVQALLGLACYVSPSFRLKAHVDEVTEVVACLCPNPPLSEEDILKDHFQERWPQCTAAGNDLIDLVRDNLAQFCRGHQIPIYPKLRLPDAVVEELYSLLDRAEHLMPDEVQAIRREEAQSPQGALHTTRRKPLMDPAITILSRRFGRDADYLSAQLEEVKPLLPALLARGRSFSGQIKKVEPITTSNSGATKLEVVTLANNKKYVRKTYLNLGDMAVRRARGLVCSGLANTIRFSHDMGEDAPEIFAVDQDSQGQWRGIMEYCQYGDLFHHMQKPDHRGPLDILGMAYMLLTLLAKAEKNGIHHRDIKLHNIFIRQLPNDKTPGVYVLGDYDNSMRVGELDLHSASPFKVGTCMPPESKELGFSTGSLVDIYATGAALYALATGKQPTRIYETKKQQTGIPILNKQSIPKTHPLRSIIDRATHEHPDERYETMAQMLDDCIDAIMRYK